MSHLSHAGGVSILVAALAHSPVQSLTHGALLGKSHTKAARLRSMASIQSWPGLAECAVPRQALEGGAQQRQAALV